jgi:RNA polymerase sigma-70 factor (ECF subfamily)
VVDRQATPAPGRGSHDLAHWIRVFEAQVDYIHRTLRGLGANRSDIDDLVQEVLLVMWRRRASYDAQRPLRPWIAGIAFRAVQEQRRRTARELLVDAPDMLADVPSTDEQMEAAQTRQLVYEALSRVPERQRIVLVMHEIDGQPIRDIAHALGIPRFTLYSRLQGGLKAFAREMRREQVVAALAPEFRLLTHRALLAVQGDCPGMSPEQRRRTLRGLVLLADRPRPDRSWRASSSQWLSLAAGAAVMAGAALLAIVGPVFRERSSGGGGREGVFALGREPNSVLTGPAFRAAARAPSPPRLEVVARPPTPFHGLVGHWRFDDHRGSATARDVSGEGNDCMLRRMDPETAWNRGAISGGVKLTGKGWLECPTTGALTKLSQEITITAWVTRGTVIQNYRALVARQLDVGRQDEFMFGFANGQLLFASHVWKGRLMRPLPPGLERWFHVAVTRRQDGLVVLFVNGTEIGRGQTRPGRLPGAGNPLIVGAAVNGWDPTRTEARFDGAIDDLAIYDRALAPAEIEALVAGRGSLSLL